MEIELAGSEWRQIVDEMFKDIDKQINEKIQHINEVLNDSRLTIQGCHKLKGKREAFQEMKEMLNK